MGISKEVKLVTTAPLRLERRLYSITGQVLGVLEITQNLSEEYKTIFKFQIFVVLTSTLVMCLLLLILIFVVKRGENIIHQRALERRKLEEQLSRAERLSSMGEMAAGISHEIRNPLGIIRSSAELLKKKMAKVDPSNTVPSIIVEETRRLNNIITDFINYAKPKSPQLTPSRVEDIIERNLTFLSTQLSEKKYRVSKDVEKDLPEVMADSAMLYQAFLNIFINCMQAMPEGGEIRVALGTSQNGIVIHFDDEGGGIPEEVLEKIWEPFFTTKEKGTGLGLGIVKNIIESHGGSIQIHNKSEKGVRVTVELPLYKR
jgi:signal transduction histidine kinase